MSMDSVVASDKLYWDPYDFGLHANPHPVWRRMREEAPLYRNEEYDFWALTRFDDVLNVLVDWKTYSIADGDLLEIIRLPPDERIRYTEMFADGDADDLRQLLQLDPPRHDMYRHLLSRSFTPRAVKQIEDRARAFAQKLLDERIGSGGFDFVDEFGAQIPASVIGTMLGTPDSDVEEIRHVIDASLAQADPGDVPAAGEDAYRSVGMSSADREVGDRIGEYFMGQIDARRRNPTDDIVSTLVTLEFTDEGGVTRKLNDGEALALVTLLSIAGNETTARHIGWVGATLARYPDQRAKLVARPELIPNAVEEILRFEPPSMCLARVATRDVVWYDQVVPAGSPLVVINAATGRDQRQFPDPDTLDVERRIDRHLSFGFGAHVCLGASLARLESRIALEEMLKRFPEWDVDWDNTDIVHTGSAIRGYFKLPIIVG